MTGPIVQLVDVGKRYGSVNIFTNVSLQASPGEILGLIGPNGAGKTTLLRLLAGMVRCDAGTILFDGAAGSIPIGGLAYFAGESTIPGPIRVSSWVRLLLGSGPLVNDSRRMRSLSRGTRQLVGLTAVLQQRQQSLILLDEPWEGLDPDASRWLSRTLSAERDTGTTIVVSSHRLYDLAGVCDRYAFLVNGSLASLRAHEVLRKDLAAADALHAALDRLEAPAP